MIKYGYTWCISSEVGIENCRSQKQVHPFHSSLLFLFLSRKFSYKKSYFYLRFQDSSLNDDSNITESINENVSVITTRVRRTNLFTKRYEVCLLLLKSCPTRYFVLSTSSGFTKLSSVRKPQFLSPFF